MNTLISGAFRNKAAVILGIVLVLAMGAYSYVRLPMEFLPEADNPMVTVTALGPGYDAASMETLVTEPLERAVSGVKGKTATLSTSGDGFSQLNLSFDSKTDMKEARAEVERAVAGVRLPERVSPPYVLQLNTSMIPVSWAKLGFAEGMSDAEKDRAEQEVLDRLNRIDGIGNVQVFGKEQAKVSITPDPAKLAERGIPLQALYGVLQGRDASAALGETRVDGASVNLNVVSNLRDVEALKRLPLGPGVTLGDVATVERVVSNRSVSRVNGEEVRLLTITKAANANAVDVGKQVEAAAEELSREIEGVHMDVLASTAREISHSVHSLLREVLMGALFATVVILLFIRNVRATLVTIVSIPLSLALTLYLLDLSGITLNVLTLGGVAVAVGRLVDDSIVVIENIFRRLQREKFSVDLVIEATREVANAITASTLTTVAVFLPMGLLRGSLQDFLLPFALTVTYSLLSSLLVALTVIPLMSAGILKNASIREHRPSRRFVSFLEWNLKHKWVPLAASLVLFVGSIGAYVSMPKGAIDSSSAANVQVTLEFKPGTPAETVLENGKRLERFLMEQEGQEWVLMQTGNDEESAKWGGVSNPTMVSYLIQMKKGADAETLIEAVQAERKHYPEAELNAGAMDFMSNGSSTQIFVDIVGDDPERLSQTAEDVMARIKPIRDVLKVTSNQEQKKTVYTLEVDPARAKAGDVAVQLQGMLNPVPIGTLTVGGQQLPVVVEPVLAPKSAADLDRLTVLTEAGPQPVSRFARWVKEEKPTVFYHKDGKDYIRVTATVNPDRLSVVGEDIRKAMDELQTPEGVQLYVGGASADQAQDFADLGAVGLISIGIVYLIMVLTFKTLRAPLAILFSLPLAAIGAVLGLLISGVNPDFTAAFGALMLIGIVVTNAIVLIDRVRQNERRMTIREALLEAAATRMRPILMTAVATICAMLPLVFGTTESGSIVSQSLAIVVIGGLTVATALTLIIVPCMYELFYFRQSAKQRRAAVQGELTA